MRTYISIVILIVAGVVGALVLMYFWIGVPTVYRYSGPDMPPPHFYNNPELPGFVSTPSDMPGRSIKNIVIYAFYFVPNDKTQTIRSEWKSTLEEDLGKLRDFHALQFAGRSEITLLIYPEPIIGVHDTRFYDSESTARGNPHALDATTEEINARVFKKNGDRTRDDFKRQANAYPVFFVYYEGMGASGGIIIERESSAPDDIARELNISESTIFETDVALAEGFFLIGTDILTGEENEYRSSTIIAHEFYHTIGLQDTYTPSPKSGGAERVSSLDIMGSGRYTPLEKTFLDRRWLAGFGMH